MHHQKLRAFKEEEKPLKLLFMHPFNDMSVPYSIKTPTIHVILA